MLASSVVVATGAKVDGRASIALRKNGVCACFDGRLDRVPSLHAAGSASASPPSFSGARIDCIYDGAASTCLTVYISSNAHESAA